jgi:hypothetical protein
MVIREDIRARQKGKRRLLDRQRMPLARDEPPESNPPGCLPGHLQPPLTRWRSRGADDIVSRPAPCRQWMDGGFVGFGSGSPALVPEPVAVPEAAACTLSGDLTLFRYREFAPA